MDLASFKPTTNPNYLLPIISSLIASQTRRRLEGCYGKNFRKNKNKKKQTGKAMSLDYLKEIGWERPKDLNTGSYAWLLIHFISMDKASLAQTRMAKVEIKISR